jgi:toluene monooxygenase system ferredoxin subunit
LGSAQKQRTKRKDGTMDKIGTLRLLETLSGLSDEQIKLMEEFTEFVDFKEGDKLFQVGGLAKSIYFLVKGKLGIQVQLSSRPETVSIVVLQNFGQLVGWSGLMEEAHYTATGICLEDSQLIQIDGIEFMGLLEQNPKEGFLVMREISKVISGRMRNLQSVVLKTM